MANKIQVKRGVIGSLPTLAQAEFGYATDTDQVFIGDGSDNHEILVLNVPLTENATIMLDQALSADTKWTGVTQSVTAGTGGLVYGYCYYLATTGKWEKTNATAASTSVGKIGMCVGAAAADATGILLMYGVIRADDEFPAFTVAAPVFISAATAGVLSSTAPTGTTDFVVRVVGHAMTADSLFFDPDGAYGTLV